MAFPSEEREKETEGAIECKVDRRNRNRLEEEKRLVRQVNALK